MVSTLNIFLVHNGIMFPIICCSITSDLVDQALQGFPLIHLLNYNIDDKVGLNTFLVLDALYAIELRSTFI